MDIRVRLQRLLNQLRECVVFELAPEGRERRGAAKMQALRAGGGRAERQRGGEDETTHGDLHHSRPPARAAMGVRAVCHPTLARARQCAWPPDRG